MRFEFITRIAAPVEKVFTFHEREDIFSYLVPPWQKVRMVSRKGGLEVGARLVFRVFIGPIPITWVAVHTAFERNRLFVDEQASGPFAYWKHRHEFSPDGAGMQLADRIEFRLKGGPLVDLLFGWLVRLQLLLMFRHRHAVTKRACEG
ncbi:MAG: SRPBCC family protein [Acidobacteria bacterium]|nr:SRPBCC family protein [Acidobacteriota bacterium]